MPHADFTSIKIADDAADERYVYLSDVLPTACQADIEDLATHRLSLEEGPRGYEIFQQKDDGAIKVLLSP